MSNSTLRRNVIAAGGYYNRARGCWVLPGSSHNCSSARVEPFFGSLAECAEEAEAHSAAASQVQNFGEAEANYLRHW